MLLEIIKGAPIWAWAGLAYGIMVGVKNLQEQFVNKKRLMILAVLFMYLSFSTMLKSASDHPVVLLLWTLCFLIGGLIGWSFLAQKLTGYNKETGKWIVAGSPVFLLLFPAIFTLKFLYGVKLAISPEDLHSVAFIVPFFTSSAIISGIMLGRIGKLLYSISLKEKSE
ncbi:DUF6622 family protein [Spirochaeta cellobiosiphila]|uniref:DUF6622 family protein n=1 Tax=Spirochaeta cellobiosiphila TaxID=504483 RepID=UPI0004002343|nr:DUF6622 family protein [Spirochaeta cellobiosiphila]